MMHPSANLVTKAESFAAICICTATRMVRGCPRHSPADSGTPESHHHMLIRIIENQEKIMSEQADFDTDITALTGFFTNTLVPFLTGLGTQLTAIQTALAAQGVTNLAPLDALALQAATISTQVQGVSTTLAGLPGGTPAAPAAPAQPAS